MSNIFHELYYKLTSKVVLEQFDHYQIVKNDQQKSLYDNFKTFIRSRNLSELKKIMKFITGSTILPVKPKIRVFIKKDFYYKLLSIY
jgi:hypothetical protein